MCNRWLSMADNRSCEHLVHTDIPSNSAATGRNTGGRVIQYCCFVDGLGVQYDDRDGICALDRGCPQRAAKI